MSDQRLILLAGWGLGAAPLQPLANALRSRLQVQIEPLPDCAELPAAQWLDALHERLPGDAWLGGWSLGGMLASQLAARRGAGCPGLVTLASNPCFVASPSWPTAMAAATFQDFRDAYRQNPAATLKRFALLCSQGAVDARWLSRALLATVPGGASQVGLELLASLDTRAALQGFGGAQLHVFADADALVPHSAALAVQALQPAARVCQVRDAGHAFVLEQASDVAALLSRFMAAQS